MKQGQQQISPLVQPLIAGYQERAQKETAELQSLQVIAKKLGSEFTKIVQNLHENEIVKRETDLFEEGAKIYKLVGMALIPQTLEESRTNVDSRIEFFKNSMSTKEKEIKDNRDKQVKCSENLNKLKADFEYALSSMMGKAGPAAK